MNIKVKNSLFKSISVILIGTVLFYLAVAFYLSFFGTYGNIDTYEKISSQLIAKTLLYSNILIALSLLIHTIYSIIKKNTPQDGTKNLTFFEWLIILVSSASIIAYLYLQFAPASISPQYPLGNKVLGELVTFGGVAALYCLSIIKLLFHFFKKEI